MRANLRTPSSLERSPITTMADAIRCSQKKLKTILIFNMYIPSYEYYFLLLLIILPVYLFFELWSWLGWQLFINN
ncbi:hypothetical protein ANTQUA_LOCUS9091 [Anthophora quadrimaculata]